MAAGVLEKDSFCASLGWLDKFMKRNKFSLRAPTTSCQKPPADYIPKTIDFILFIRKLRKDQAYPIEHIFACDETAVWLDPIGKRCVTQRGAKDVTVQTLGHEKLHITVMLCASSSGIKCKPFVLLSRKRPVPSVVQKFSGKFILNWAGKVWMDNTSTEDFIRRGLGPLVFGKRLLVWDAFRCHLTKETKAVLKDLRIDQAVVPGGCTKYVQAPDVCWNQPFKAAIGKLHEDWMVSGVKEYTRGGNPRPPPMDVYLQWVVDAWASISNDLIKDSFKACGITVNLDGSEDEMIHCFKPHGPIPEGFALLKEKETQQPEDTVQTPSIVPEDAHWEENEMEVVSIESPDSFIDSSDEN